MVDAMLRIDAFAHILPRRYLDRLEKHLETTMDRAQLDYYREGVFSYDRSLSDVGERLRRLEPFDGLKQVLVLAVPPLEEVGPPAVAAEFSRLANDEMAELVRSHPDRFAGFAAALPWNDPDLAARELERAVSELGALGAQLFTNVNGVTVDDERFAPVLARAESLDRALWLHPTRRASPDYGLWWSLGWPYETAAALGRLVYSGAMERLPRLRVIAHHGGGMVPHFSARLAMGPGVRQVAGSLPRPPLEYFRRFYADTALFGAAHAVRCVLDFFGPDHVLFGTDMPLGPPDGLESTIADLEAAGLSAGDLEKVYAGNVVALTGLAPR
jgi:aminocarboxymuconate-semialdehyde decarboxylase